MMASLGHRFNNITEGLHTTRSDDKSVTRDKCLIVKQHYRRNSAHNANVTVVLSVERGF